MELQVFAPKVIVKNKENDSSITSAICCDVFKGYFAAILNRNSYLNYLVVQKKTDLILD